MTIKKKITAAPPMPMSALMAFFIAYLPSCTQTPITTASKSATYHSPCPMGHLLPVELHRWSIRNGEHSLLVEVSQPRHHGKNGNHRDYLGKGDPHPYLLCDRFLPLMHRYNHIHKGSANVITSRVWSSVFGRVASGL